MTSLRRFRAVLLCTIGTLAPLSAAQAEEAAEADADTIVVTGTRPIAESEAAALKVQREADSLVTVAASDSVGRLPDQNVAQAASRLPGIAIERDQGQARYISLRGAPNYWTTLSFDGINVVSPEGRDARFDSVPSAIAAQIVVSKAVTPDMPGETVSGNVNVITRSAFDYGGLHAAGKAGIGFAELGDKREYEGSLVLSDRLPLGEGELGVLVSASYYERNMVTDNFENDWERVAQDQRPGAATRFWVHETENKLYRLTRRNWSVSGRLDWKPDSANTVSLRSIYTIFTDDEARDNYRFDLDDRQGDLVADPSACTITPNPTPTTSGYADVCIGNTPLKGTIYGIDIRQRSTLRAFRQSIFTNTLEGKHDFADGWNLAWLANYTQSKDDRSVVGEIAWDSPSTRGLRPTVGYDFSDPGFARLTLFNTVQLSSPTRYQAGTQVTAIDTFAKTPSSLTVLDAVDTTDAYTGKLVLSRETALLGGDATLKLGFQFDQRTKVVDENQILLNTAAQLAAIALPSDYNAFSLSDPFLGKIAMGYTFRYFNTDLMRAASEAARSRFTAVPVTGNIYDVREQVFAGFLMGTVKYDWGSILGGVRVEHLKNRGIATATVAGVTGPVTAEASRTMAFPSLHLNFNVDDTKKLRLSFNSGAARADYDQLRPNVTINDANQAISGGNPAVKPEKAYGVDAYFEWYLRPQGYLMAGVFYKKVKDVLYRQTRTFGSDALNSGGIDRSGYVFTGITNGGDGRVYGFEAAAQLQLEPWTANLGLPEWMGGFGISANLTLNNSEVTKPAIGAIPNRKVRLPGTSDVVYNVGGYYEKYGLSLRLQYQRRSTWLDGIADDLADGGDTYWAADDELDFSARYAITKNVEIYFDASNLLNKPGRRYSEPGNLLTATGTPSPTTTNQTIEWERFGRRYSGGIRVNF
ncbi:TonB-dependent receptor [Novosphingobium ginsenosidimutans]|uniref:TonB-dependent receptor n=1 Tax=Novosphingobium ginsenosidimutans TaxID=1176536 RepID=A0A5B8S2E4_9SPHN|nr:TonB-dependent receptor [Novosphingobium ginsenosidimutans]QEA15202.1 TonB-dependent receptor [Novosphingobium ginsenosidimutans]